jgi:hypothetical protein
LLDKYPIVFEEYNEMGEMTGLKVNALLDYLRKLEADFIKYYKTLAPKKVIDESAKIQDFHDMLKGA